MDSIYYSATRSTSDEESATDVGYNDLFKLPYEDESDAPDAPETPRQRRHRLTLSEGDATWLQSGGTNRPMRLQAYDRAISDVSCSFDSLKGDDDRDDEAHNHKPSHLEACRDELDNFKNRDLETLRKAVEEVVEGVEGMMSLAVTKALMEADDVRLDGLDHASMAANFLCEVFGWRKRQEESLSLDSVNEYFQDVLNRIVMRAVCGAMSPLQGARLVHECTAVLGLDLLKPLPATTVVITEMRKANDLAKGRDSIFKAFQPFGNIEEVAIAPNNHGFGFVRFTMPESALRALEKFQEFAMKIQDMSVSIKLLESDSH